MDEFEQEPTKEQKIWQVVAAIPQGKVASYGQVAAMAGLGRQGHKNVLAVPIAFTSDHIETLVIFRR